MNKVPVLDRNFQIVIPTHGRSERQDTLRKLPPSVKDRTLVVTSLQSEVKEIQKNYGHRAVFSLEAFGALESHGQYIHTKRQWIVENIKSKYLMQLDDDMTFHRRCPVKYRQLQGTKSNLRWKLTDEGKELEYKLLYTATPKAIEKCMELVEKSMGKGFVHGCVGSRLGNDLDKLEIDTRGGRSMHAIVHDREFLLENNVRFDQIDFREDFNVTLNLLRRGLPNVRIFYYAVSPNDYGKTGGCSSYRTFEASNEAAIRLALLHPGFVTPNFKNYSFSGDRVEVVVKWQDALSKGPDLGNVVVSKPLKCRPGTHVVLPYESDTEMYTLFDGDKWSTPSFSPKENAKTWHSQMPFRLKKKSTLFS